MAFLNDCCGCFNLRQGTLIIGTLYLIGSLIITIALLVVVADYDYYKSQNLELQLEGSYGVLVTLLVVAFVFIFVCGALVRGAQKGDRVLLLPWITWNFVYLACSFGTMIVKAVGTFGGAQKAGYVLGYFISFFIDVYLLLVVMSFYQDLANQNRPRYNA